MRANDPTIIASAISENDNARQVVCLILRGPTTFRGSWGSILSASLSLQIDRRIIGPIAERIDGREKLGTGSVAHRHQLECLTHEMPALRRKLSCAIEVPLRRNLIALCEEILPEAEIRVRRGFIGGRRCDPRPHLLRRERIPAGGAVFHPIAQGVDIAPPRDFAL